MLTHGGHVCTGNYACCKVPVASAELLLQVMQHELPDHETELNSFAWLQNLLFEDKVAKLKEQFSELTHAEIFQMLTATDGIYDSAYALLCQRKEELQEQVRGHQGLIVVNVGRQFHTMRSSAICDTAVLMTNSNAIQSLLQPLMMPVLLCAVVGRAFGLLYHLCPCSTTFQVCLPSPAASHLKVCTLQDAARQAEARDHAIALRLEKLEFPSAFAPDKVCPSPHKGWM